MASEFGEDIVAIGESMTEHSSELAAVGTNLNNQFEISTQRSPQINRIITQLARASSMLDHITEDLDADWDFTSQTKTELTAAKRKLTSTSDDAKAALEGTNNQSALNGLRYTADSITGVSTSFDSVAAAHRSIEGSQAEMRAIQTALGELIVRMTATKEGVIETGVQIASAQQTTGEAAHEAHAAGEEFKQYGETQ
jgi:ABC-type transporter Mla subunit MlaD